MSGDKPNLDRLSPAALRYIKAFLLLELGSLLAK